MSEINVYLKNNEAKECCFFTYNYLEHKIDENLISKGCYKFSVEKNNNPNLSYETMPFLTLTYKTDEDGKLTNENISASSHKFNLIGPSSAIYSILNKYLGVDWDQLSKFVNIRSDIALAPTMQMQEEGTEYGVSGFSWLVSFLLSV